MLFLTVEFLADCRGDFTLTNNFLFDSESRSVYKVTTFFNSVTLACAIEVRDRFLSEFIVIVIARGGILQLTGDSAFPASIGG